MSRSRRPLLPSAIPIMMVVGGLTAANVHYAPPLLPSMATAFGVRADRMGLLTSLSQAGLALGLLLILPLADMLERRRLLVCVLGSLAVAALGVALAPDLPALYAGVFLLGVGCVGAQLLPPYAALLAPPSRQGEAVGLVLSGILCGAFVSKVVAGLAGAGFGWRAPYVFSAAAMAVSALAVAKAAPASRPEHLVKPAAVFGSMAALLRTHRALRRHALNGAMISGAIMAFWSTYSLHLAHAFGYGPARAGLFGFVGIAGTLCASAAGKQIDGGRFAPTNLTAGVLLTGGFACLWAGGTNLAAFILGVLLIDAGAGLGHAANQARAFRLDPEARGRINSVYMTSYFLGGAVFTAVAVPAYAALGWAGVCLLGATLGAVLSGLQVMAPISDGPRPREGAAAQAP